MFDGAFGSYDDTLSVDTAAQTYRFCFSEDSPVITLDLDMLNSPGWLSMINSARARLSVFPKRDQHTMRTRFVSMGNGLEVGLKDAATWQVCANGKCFDLKEPSDFYRVLILLNQSLEDAAKLICSGGGARGVANPFPFWMVVWAGMSQSDEWAALALQWVPELPVEDQERLVGALDNVRHARWASQRSRQFAEQNLKRIQRRGAGRD